MHFLKSLPFRDYLTHPLLIAFVGLIGVFWQYDVGKDVGRQEGVKETEDRLLPTISALETRTVYLGITNVHVDASVFPFESTGVELNRGDQVKIIPIGQGNTWDCSNGGEISAVGFKNGESRDLWIDPGANFCELIGRIGEDGPFIHIGSKPDFLAPKSGTLYLGANDMWPHYCPTPYDCFADNQGRLFVQIQTTKLP